MGILRQLMDILGQILAFAADLIWNTPTVLPAMVVLLLCTGVFLTIRTGFVQFRRLGHSIKVIAGRYDSSDHKGDVSHYQALTSALAATVGIGNIAGVATAIHYGGPGAVFWLWITGFLGMATKFVECTLSQKYRVVHKDGSVSGGPMYYIEKGLGPRWKWVGILFASCAVIGSMATGNSIQAFTMADSFRSDFGIPPWISGLVSASLVGAVIVGGIKRIGTVTGKLVPFMGLMYVLAALTIVVLNIERLPEAVTTIVSGAFSPPGMVGGFAGSTFIFTLTWGVKRGLFSNEAGQGSAPIAHAAARTDRPVREGSVALMEPLIDTVVICFITGLVIVTTGTWNEKHPDHFDISAKSGLSWVVPDTKPGSGGKIDDESLFSGKAPVIDGHLNRADVIRNHSVVEKLVISYDNRPLDGFITVKDNVAQATDSSGRQLTLSKVFMDGECLFNGSPLTAQSFAKGLAPIFPWGNLLITVAVFFFAVSTAISWSYYGDRAIMYLFGKKAVLPYKIVFTVIHFVGAVVSLEMVWSFGDAALGLMAIPNLIALIILSRSVKTDSDTYFADMAVLDDERRHAKMQNQA